MLPACQYKYIEKKSSRSILQTGSSVFLLLVTVPISRLDLRSVPDRNPNENLTM
jgi:hypothetical protein